MRHFSVAAILAPAALVTVLMGQSMAGGPTPAEGWTLHIDAKLHFPAKPDMIAHHYCNEVAGGVTECQLYDSDSPNARLVGTEVIVSPFFYNDSATTEK